jgi:hypothetical protein
MRNCLIYFVCLYLCIGTAFACPVEDKRECVVNTALSQVGVMELTGKNDGVEVEKYLASVGLSKGYAWCAAFVHWVYEDCNADIVKSAWSPSFFPVSKTVFRRGSKQNKQPIAADVFGLYFQNLKRVAHVGIIKSWNDRYVITIEGNTSNANSGETTREGDGVYRKRRLTRSIYVVSSWL